MRKNALLKLVVGWGLFLLMIGYSIYLYSYKAKRYTYTLPYPYGHPTGTLPWIPFKWIGNEIKRKQVEKNALCVPVKIDNIPHDFYFQFDMGSTYTMLYENSLQPYLDKYPQLSNKLERKRPELMFWDDSKDFADLQLALGSVPFTGSHVYIKRSYGRVLNHDSITNNSQKIIGTIGVDMLQTHVVIIDYPNQRICILDTLPVAYNATFSPFHLSRHGKVLLQMKYNGLVYDVIFDTGSSIFSLLTSGERLYLFSGENNNDTIPIVSWGEVHRLIGRHMPGTVLLNNIPFSNVEVYGDYRLNDELLKEEKADAVTGNALFWNKTVVIDFKRKLFGVL